MVPGTGTETKIWNKTQDTYFQEAEKKQMRKQLDMVSGSGNANKNAENQINNCFRKRRRHKNAET